MEIFNLIQLRLSDAGNVLCSTLVSSYRVIKMTFGNMFTFD